MTEHILKCWPNSYDAIASGVKRFEYRLDDRGYEIGDVLILRKWDPRPLIDAPQPRGQVYTRLGELTEQRVRVTYILRGQFGVPADYCVMSIERIEEK